MVLLVHVISLSPSYSRKLLLSVQYIQGFILNHLGDPQIVHLLAPKLLDGFAMSPQLEKEVLERDIHFGQVQSQT